MTLHKSVDQSTILLGERTKFVFILYRSAFFPNSYKFSRLKDLLRLRLNECGWSDEVRLLCREVVKSNHGNVNVDEIVEEVTPKARQLVPDSVKKELLQKIKTILIQQEGLEI